MAGSWHASATPRAGAPAWALALLLGATGCTICPDPFDYSGPVPNGSAPHNDFRARSGGIAPIDGVPRPWPPVVEAVPDAEREARTAVAAAEPAGADAAVDSPVQTVATGVTTTPVEPPAEPATAVEPTVDDVLPPREPARAEIVPPLLETPGWRPRD